MMETLHECEENTQSYEIRLENDQWIFEAADHLDYPEEIDIFYCPFCGIDLRTLSK